MTRSIATFCLLVNCLLILAEGVSAQEFEYQVKAEFLERFTRFIEWPADSQLSDPKSDFRLCVIGKNPFGSYLQDMAEEVRIKGKPVKILEISQPSQSEGCDLLFVSRSEEENIPSILQYTGNKPILTVGDGEGFAKRGVIINFVKAGSRIVFEINPDAVKRSRLRVSSRLMGLAREATEERGE